MAVTPERMSLAEFLRRPETKPAFELRRGVVSQKMPPSGPHGSIQLWFGAQIYNFAELRELAQAFTETRLILGRDTYVPDVSVYLWERVPEDEHGNLPFYFTTPPDIVVEVVSPGQTVRSQRDRCIELIGHGVRIAVLVAPDQRSVFVIRTDGEVGPLREGDTINVGDVLPGFQIAVTDVLARIRPRRRRREP
jgi:Uma2 family endonuclease